MPILTAVGVSAAAILVYKQVRRSRAGGNIESLLSHCARAASVLDRRIVDAPISLAS